MSRTNFAQDWAQEAKEASPKQEATLPEEYNRHGPIFDGGVRLKLAFCTTCAVRILVLAQGPSF